MKEAKLSPEQMGRLLGISGMTIRRWKSFPSGKELPTLYSNALIGVANQLISQNKIAADSPIAKDIFKSGWAPYGLMTTSMGITSDSLEKFRDDPRGAIETLSEIGGDKDRKQLVDQSQGRIRAFEKKGKDWKTKITSLFAVIQSKQLQTTDKLVAYGAFFYLLNIFDFIPDTIPVFGLMDDFFVLGLAVGFYLNRHPEIFGHQKK